MPQFPKPAPKGTLNLIDGDQYTIRVTLTDKRTGARVDLTGCEVAWQVRKAYGDASALLTLATAGYTGFTNDTGCLITVLPQTGDTLGQIDCTFDLLQNDLVPGDFNAETTDGVTSYKGVHDLQIKDSGGQTRTYLRGSAVLRQEVTETP